MPANRGVVRESRPLPARDRATGSPIMAPGHAMPTDARPIDVEAGTSSPDVPSPRHPSTSPRSGEVGSRLSMTELRPITTEPQWERRWEPRRRSLTEAELALADDYRWRTELFTGWREQLVGRLAPRRGDTVVDVGCGAGLNLAALRAAVGPSGTVIAVDPSTDLLNLAAAQVAQRNWDNVELINAPVETVQLSAIADAALFAATPDVLASPVAVGNVVGQLRDAAGVAAGGWNWPSAWLWPLRRAITALARPFIAEPVALRHPWRLLQEHAALHVDQSWLGTGYFAHGYIAT